MSNIPNTVMKQRSVQKKVCITDQIQTIFPQNTDQVQTIFP